MKKIVPKSTIALLVITCAVAYVCAGGEIPAFVWLVLTLVGILVVWAKYSTFVSKLDNPAPVEYKLKPFGVWGTIDTALRARASEWKNVSIHVELSIS